MWFWIVLLLLTPPVWATPPLEQKLAEAYQKEEAGDYGAAQRIYQEILKETPDFEPALFGLAEVHYWQGHYETAEKYYQQLVQKNPQHFEGLLGLSKVYLAMGKQRQAEDYLEKAKRLDPENKELEALAPQLERKTRLRIHGGYTAQDVGYYPSNTQASFQEITVHKEKTYGFGLRTTYLRQFDLNGFDTDLSGHYYFKEKTRAELGFSFAPNVLILPRESVRAGLAHSFWKFTPEIHYTFENYSQADRHQIAPALFFEPMEWLRVGGGYEYRRLLFGGNHRDLHSGFGKIGLAVKEWLSLNGFYERVQRGFEGGRPGSAFVNYTAHVGGGGIALDFVGSYSIHFDAYTERRNNGEQIASYTFSLGYIL